MISKINLSSVPPLTWFECQDNLLTELDIRPLKYLKTLMVNDHVRILGTRP